MMNHNHKNSDCGFGELLVSYLYGETSGAEAAEFEKHLPNCQSCAGETEAFSSVHFAIEDWKTKDFAPLATPVIEIPGERKVQPAIVQTSWLAGLRQLFSLSPAWSLATASVAVLAICAGLVWLALSARQSNDVAETNKNAKSGINVAAQKTPPTDADGDQNRKGDVQVSPINQPPVTTSEAADQTKPNARAVKINNPRPAQKTDGTPKNNAAKRDNKKQAMPKVLSDDDDEDDSLRLAELFDEIGTE